MATLKTPNMQDLLEAGAHFGHQVRRGNPRMKPFIFGARDGVHIVDLAHTEEKLKEATEAAYNLGKEGKVLLIVGTKKQAKEIVEGLAKEVDTPYINSHWVGGLLTNFEEIRKNIKKLNELKEEKEKGELSRYTKKEQLLIDKKLKKFEEDMGGIANMGTVPDAIFLVDTVAEGTAVREALKMGIVLFGISDTNSDPTALDFPIPGNDDGIKSIKLITETVIKAYGEGKKLGMKNEELRIKQSLRAEALKKEEEKTEKEKTKQELKDKQSSLSDKAVVEEAAAIEEEVEKKIVDESSGKAA